VVERTGVADAASGKPASFWRVTGATGRRWPRWRAAALICMYF